MKINITWPDEKNLSKVRERFHRFADTRGVPHEEAMISAVPLWMEVHTPRVIAAGGT